MSEVAGFIRRHGTKWIIVTPGNSILNKEGFSTPEAANAACLLLGLKPYVLCSSVHGDCWIPYGSAPVDENVVVYNQIIGKKEVLLNEK